MPSPQPSTRVVEITRLVRGFQHDPDNAGRPLELAVTKEVLDEITAGAGLEYPIESDDVRFYGLPLVVDDRIPPALGGWGIRPRGERWPNPLASYHAGPSLARQVGEALEPRPLVIRNGVGHRATVGHAEDVVQLIVHAKTGVGSITFTPAQARELGVLLIEQAGHAAAAALTEQDQR